MKNWNALATSVLVFIITLSSNLQAQKADQQITFESLSAKTYGDLPFDLVATATSGLLVQFTSSNSLVATVNRNSVTIVGAGETIITASQTGDDNFNPAQSVRRALVVVKANQIIIFEELLSKTYGDGVFFLSASTTSDLPISYSSNSPVVSIVGNQVTILGAGFVEITASQPGNANHLPAEDVVRSLTINKAPQSIVFSIIPSKTYGDLPFTLTASASSGLPINFSSQYDSVLTIEGSTGTIVGAGTLKVYAIQNGNENYLPKTVEQTLIINKAPQSITFGPLASKKFGDSPFAVSATSTSGLPVSFSSSRKTVAKVAGHTVTIVGAGTAPIVASQAGNSNYLAAPNIIQPLIISVLGNSYQLLGTTRRGGNGRGTIFNINTNGSDFVTQKNFNSNAYNSPQSGLIKGSDGKLYGMIMAGGNPSNGVVFSIQPDGSAYTVLHNFNFTDGQRPFGNVMEASNGYLYGMTYDGGVNNTGVIFRLQKDGSEFSKLFEFPNAGVNGYHPLGGLIEATNGDLFGTTAEGGVVAYGVLFTIKKDGSGYTKLLDLNGNATKGGFSRGDLIQGPDQYLYGTAIRGGSSSLGVLFKVKTDGTDYINLIEFDGTSKGSTPGSSLIFGTDGKLYGTTQAGGVNDLGVVYSVSTDGTGFNKLFDFDGTNSGSAGIGKLVQSSDGDLYGMTNSGGASNLGIAFKIKTDGTGFTKLMDFNGQNGATPVFGNLLEIENGKFVGMTSRGGPSNSGIVFSITSDGTFGIVKDFPQPEGTPEVISSSDGNNYYGVASSGGPNGNGVIFKTSANGSDYEKIHDLIGNVLYVRRLIHTSDNQLWGSGTEGVFTVTSIIFKLNTDGSDFQRVEFDEAPGLSIGYLIEGPDKFLYGTGFMDGSPHGVIFRFKTDGTNFEKIADIPGGSLGSRPTENLVISSDGNLFGLTHEGGANNWGSVFKLNIATLQYSRIFSLQTTTTGSYPKKMALLNDGSLCIVTAVGGANNSGTIFSISPDGSDYNKIFDFNSSTCSGPTDIIQTVDGYLIGSTEYGGLSNNGIIYEMLTDGSNFKNIFEFTGANGSIPNSIKFRRSEQIVSFNPLNQKQYNDPPFALSATISSGLPIIFTSSNESIASIENNIVTIHGVGEVTITASVAGNVNFAQAQVQRTLVVVRDDQTITFDPAEDHVIGDAAFNINAIASSGLEVEFSSMSNHISVTGGTVTLLSPGSVTIEANQSGDMYYNAAPSTYQTFCINPTKPIVTASEVTFENVILTSSNAIGNQWYKNGEIILGETSALISISENGSYTVATSVEGCTSEPSEAYIMMITGVDEEGGKASFVYPNPGTDKVKLNLSSFSQLNPVEIQISDINGREIQHLTFSGQPEVELEIESMEKGVYFLRATSNRNMIIVRFVKQ